MSNVLTVNDCFGCGLCSVVCKHDLIDMRLNDNGFYQPSIINQDTCVDCGLCVRVCSFLDKQRDSQPIQMCIRDSPRSLSSGNGGCHYG